MRRAWGLWLAIGLALAQTPARYRVAGPDSAQLAEAVAAALAQWRALDGALIAELDPNALHTFRFGEPERFPPGLYSLTLQREINGVRTVESLLLPASARFEQALAHQVGLLLGLPPAAQGIMQPRFSEATPEAPGELERAALAQLKQFPREDINRDGVVDFYDLVRLARAFGQRGVNLPEDLNQDGVVDERDLELLRARYTFTPPSPTPPGAAEAGDGDAAP